MPYYDSETENAQSLKAGALLCPVCCVEYIEVQIDLDIDGFVLENVEALRCPICQEEQFTRQQQETIEKRLRNAKP